jgi:hypothetical protein
MMRKATVPILRNHWAFPLFAFPYCRVWELVIDRLLGSEFLAREQLIQVVIRSVANEQLRLPITRSNQSWDQAMALPKSGLAVLNSEVWCSPWIARGTARRRRVRRVMTPRLAEPGAWEHPRPRAQHGGARQRRRHSSSSTGGRGGVRRGQPRADLGGRRQHPPARRWAR